MSIDFMLIFAVPTLVGLYVLYKTVMLHRRSPQVKVLHRTMYVCPSCGRTFMEQASVRGCSCRQYPMSGDNHTPPVFGYEQSPFSPELVRKIAETQRRGEEILLHLNNRSGPKVVDAVINLSEPEAPVADNRRLEVFDA